VGGVVRHRRVRSGAADLAVSETGSGLPVVLLHAGVADRRGWYPVLQALADRYRVLAYDQRGHGETGYQPEPHSPVEDLRAVLDGAGMDRAVLVGCSRGGQIAAEAAFRWPRRVLGLVLIGSSPAGAPEPPDIPEPIDSLFEAIDAAETAGDLAEVNRLEAHLWLDGPLAAEHRVGGPARDLFLDMNGRALAAPATGQPEELPPRWHQLADLAVPTLVLVGEHDLPLLQERAGALAAAVPGARSAVLAGSAHLPMLDRPEELASRLGAFLADLSRSP
jgi:pimeloyl-ACP methyl ester carboxylesterase